MQKKIEILKKCPLFDGIKEDDLLRMLTCFGAKQEFFDKKYTIFLLINILPLILSVAIIILINVSHISDR